MESYMVGRWVTESYEFSYHCEWWNLTIYADEWQNHMSFGIIVSDGILQYMLMSDRIIWVLVSLWVMESYNICWWVTESYEFWYHCEWWNLTIYADEWQNHMSFGIIVSDGILQYMLMSDRIIWILVSLWVMESYNICWWVTESYEF